MRRLSLLLVTVLASLIPLRAVAQTPDRPRGGTQPDGSCYPNCGDEDAIPPDIDLTPLYATVPSVQLTVGWCDNTSLAAATRWITVNGQDSTGAFDWQSGVGTTDCEYLTRDHARADVFDYIERFYNPVRRHSTLQNLSPVTFEQTMATR